MKLCKGHKLTEDISKKAVLILVVIAVVISILRTTLVMNAVYHYAPGSVPVEEEAQIGEPTGRVTLTVPGAPEEVSATGKVTLTVP